MPVRVPVCFVLTFLFACGIFRLTAESKPASACVLAQESAQKEEAPQDENAPEQSPAEKQSESKPQSEQAADPESGAKPEVEAEPETDKTPAASDTNSNPGDDGEADLSAATMLRLEIKKKEQATGKVLTADMDRVIELYESALKKGLSGPSEVSAKELLQGLLFEYAKGAANPILNGRRKDPRWQFYRQQALKKLERLEELGNQWSETYILIAKLNALPNGDQPAAVEAASKAVKYAGEDVKLLSEALFIRGSLSEDERARMADFNQALKIDPENIAALQQHAMILITTGEYEAAIDDYEKLIELTDGNPLAYQQLVEAMLLADRIDEALEVSDEAISRDDTQAAMHALRAKIFISQYDELVTLRSEDPEETAAADSGGTDSDDEKDDDDKGDDDKGDDDEAEDGIAVDKSTPEDKRRQELDDEIEETAKLALDALNKALDLNPKDISSLMLRARMLLTRDDIAGAKRDVDRLLVLAPGSVDGIFFRSIISGASGQFAEAAKDLELLVQNDPDNIRLRLQLATMYSADNAHEKAIKVYEEILKEDNENIDALRGLADAQLGDGLHAEAKATYERALVANPDDDHILNNLAWLLATSPDESLRNGEQAVELGLKACELTDFKKPHILSTLAAAYAESGDFEKAREWSAKSVELAEGEELEALKNELETYKRNEPMREKQESKEDDSLDNGGGDFEF